ncbi:MAG TPA: amidohydrolase family protein, partial [Thermoanaerobaculia bacterium]
MRETLFGLSLALLALGFAGPTSASGPLSTGTPVASDPAGPADKIFFGGPVLTMKMKEDPKDGMVVARAVAVRKGIIVDVGDEKSVRNDWKGPSTQLIDLHGHALLPGFVEPHTHLTLTVQSQPGFSVDCGSQAPNLSVTKVYALLKQGAAKGNSWVVGTGFDPSRSDPLFASMTAHDLDVNVTAEIPVFVLNASGHIAYVNTEALK